MGVSPQTIAITGSSGLVGSALSKALLAEGHHVVRLVRSGTLKSGEIAWNPVESPDPGTWDNIDALVHLAGANIASKRWSSKQKDLIASSRVGPTAALAKSLAQAKDKPRTLICASAIGYYGDSGSSWVDESAPAGDNFLSRTCQDWEAACEPAKEAGIRVVHLRTGLVLDKEEGALAKMLTPFRLGLGGRVGSGDQYWSWVSLQDVVGMIQHALRKASVAGPLNIASPNPVTNAEFTKVLGKALGRPTLIPLPKFLARFALGRDMADELLLASCRVRPAALADSGYAFHHTDLALALKDILD